MDATPAERVAAMIREALSSAGLEPIEDADPGPHGSEFDFDPAFYTPLSVATATLPFGPDEGDWRATKPVLLRCVAGIRHGLEVRRIGAKEAKAWVPDADAGDWAVVVWFRLPPFVLAAAARPDPQAPADDAGAMWELKVAINVDDEALD